MKKVKIIVISASSLLLVLIGIYIGVSIYLSSIVNGMMEENYDSYGENISEKYADFISREDYEYACYHEDRSEIVSEKNDTSFPLTIWWRNKATVYYDYEYAANDANDELVYLSTGTIEFSLEYNDGKWTVTEVYEPV